MCVYSFAVFLKLLWDSRPRSSELFVVWVCWWVLRSQWRRKWPSYLEPYSCVSAYFDRHLGSEFHDWWITIVSHGAMCRHGAIIVLLKKKEILTLVKRVRKTLFRTVIDTKCHNRGETTGSTWAGCGWKITKRRYQGQEDSWWRQAKNLFIKGERWGIWSDIRYPGCGFSLNWLGKILVKTGLSRPSKEGEPSRGLVRKRAQRSLTEDWQRESLSGHTDELNVRAQVSDLNHSTKCRVNFWEMFSYWCKLQRWDL